MVKTNNNNLLFVTLILFTLFIHSSMVNAKAEPIDIPRLNKSKLSIDAKLDESQWQDAVSVDINNITYPEENQLAKATAKGLMFEDGETLYIGFIARDPEPQNIRAFLRDRDSNNIWKDDMIGIKLDTYGDSKLAYQFWVNALGVQVDSIENVVTNSETTAWDAIWDSAGRLTDQGYVVEIALPLRILNFNEQLDSQQWKVELVRFYPRETHQRISNMTIDPNDTCKVCQMGQLRGLKGIKQGKNITVVPSMTLGAGQSREVEPGALSDWSTQTNSDLGLDLKWGITPDVSLNATFNPDFSQIEADAGQLSINNTFSLFFQEKRTFFLDNIDYFSTPMDLVYTRNVSDPDYGAKLTGRMNAHSFGVFGANDVSTALFIPGNLGSSIAFMDEESQNAVLRYRYDPNESLSVGWIATMRSADNDYHNYVSGFDLKYKISKLDSISAQWLYSDTQYPSHLFEDFVEDQDDDSSCDHQLCGYNEQVLRTKIDDNFTDDAYTFHYSHEERDWDAFVKYTDMGKDYRADLGFTNIVDWNKLIFGGNRIWRADGSNWWNRIRIGGDWDITHNDNGELLEKETQAWFVIDGASQSSIYLQALQRDRVGKRYDQASLAVTDNAPLFRENTFEAQYHTTLGSGLETALRLNFGDEIDFANNRLGESFTFRPSVTWNPNKHITIKTNYTHKALDADGQKVFTAKLLDTRLTYQFSVRSFIRLAVIYSDIERNPLNYIEQVEQNPKNLSTQLLYSYKLNPQTLFFVGYSDSAYANDEINDLTKDNRTLFMKFSYAWLQ